MLSYADGSGRGDAIVEQVPGAIDPTRSPSAVSGLASLATLCVAATGRVLLWSPSAAELFGKTAAEVHGQHVCDAVLNGEHHGAFAAALDSAAAGTATAALLPVRLNDTVVPVEFRWEPMTGAGGQAMVVVSAQPRRGEEDVTAPWTRLSDQTVLSIGATLDLRRIARALADAFTSRFCFGAGVYLLERLLVDDPTPFLDESESRIILRRMALRVADGPSHEWASAFPTDEVIAYSAETRFVQSIRSRRPMFFDELDTQTLGMVNDRVSVRPLIREVLDYENFLTLPLIARGNVLGLAVLARRTGEPSFTPAEAALAMKLADHAAVCMDNGRLYERERRTSTTLQRSLLPVTLKAPPGMRIAHRYRPAGQATRIGGDWYDVIPLPGSQVALVVGDAMGHGTAAALVMGQLRTAVRILARLGLPPADLLRHLDEIAQELTTAQFATCVYALCDPASRMLTIARAGHVPPVLAGADGGFELLDLPPGLPLGVGEAGYEAMRIRLPEDSTLVLYTDGLIENRARDLDTGLAELRAILSGAPTDLEARCDAIVTNLHDGVGGDDATLLLARIDPHAGR